MLCGCLPSARAVTTAVAPLTAPPQATTVEAHVDKLPASQLQGGVGQGLAAVQLPATGAPSPPCASEAGGTGQPGQFEQLVREPVAPRRLPHFLARSSFLHPTSSPPRHASQSVSPESVSPPMATQLPLRTAAALPGAATSAIGAAAAWSQLPRAGAPAATSAGGTGAAWTARSGVTAGAAGAGSSTGRMHAPSLSDATAALSVTLAAATTPADIPLGSIVEALPHGVLAVNEAGAIVLVNARTEAMFGWPRAELVGRPLETLLPQQLRAMHVALRGGFMRAPATRQMGSGRKLRGLRRDGSEILLEVGLNPVDYGDGKLVLASLVDVSVREAMAEARASAEARFAVVVESAPNGLLLVNARGCITLVNAQIERMFGYDRGALLGLPVEVLIPARFRDVHPGHRAGFFAAPSTRQMGVGRDLFAVRRDGSEFPVEIGLQPMPLPGDDVAEGISVLAAVVDVTERRRNEAVVREKEAAERAVRARNASVARMSHEVRTPLNGIIGMATLLVDADPPLSAEHLSMVRTIQSCGEGLLVIINDILDYAKLDSAKLDIERIPMRPAVVLREAVDILSFKALASRLTISTHIDASVPACVWGDPTRLRQVLLNVLGNSVKFTPAGGSIAIEVHTARAGDANDEVPPDAPQSSGSHVMGASPFAAALASLPASASMHGSTSRSRSGPAAIPAVGRRTSAAESVASSGHVSNPPDAPMLKFVITDTGVGVSPSAMPRLFTAFGQADASTTRRFGGTGLGLSICASLVKLMGGRIVLTSLPGAGTTVVVTVAGEPCADDGGGGGGGAATQVAHAAGAVAGGSGGNPRRAPRRQLVPPGTRLLLAEDDAVNQRLARAFVERVGFTVDVAANGAEAVAAWSTRPPDFYAAILMDVEMPVMDGCEATRLIRAKEAAARATPAAGVVASPRHAALSTAGQVAAAPLPLPPHIPIIAVTASTMVGDRERFLAIGMDDHLSKPIRVPELEAVLQRWAAPRGPSPVAEFVPSPIAAPPAAPLRIAVPAMRSITESSSGATLASDALWAAHHEPQGAGDESVGAAAVGAATIPVP